MVFQNYALYPHMTVYDNMGFSLKLRKADKAEISSRVSTAADILGLKPLLDRYPRQLSAASGSVAMGRAIVRDPQVFLFDEPLSNLDAAARRHAHRDQGTAPAPEDDDRLCHARPDRGHDHGRQDRRHARRHRRADRAPLDLYDRPATMFVAGFIGSPAMNFLKGKPRLQRFGRDLQSPIRPVASRRFRACRQRGQAGRAGRTSGASRVRTDRARRSMSSSSNRWVRNADRRQVGRQEIICLFRDRVMPNPGDTVASPAIPKLVHLFDPDTGKTQTPPERRTEIQETQNPGGTTPLPAVHW